MGGMSLFLYGMSRMRKQGNKVLLFFGGIVAAHLGWQALASALGITALPGPAAVYGAAGRALSAGLHLHALASLARAAGGIAAALAVGVPLGLVMARSRAWDSILNPLVYFAYPAPKTALLPVVLLFFGLGERSKVILIALIVVFQVAVAVRGAALNVPEEAYRHMASMGATRMQALRHVTLPAILPELIVSAKLAVGTALSVLFFTEAYGTHTGLGWYIMDAWSRVDYPGMYLGILALSLLGLGLFAALDALGRRLCRWKRCGPRD